jgi:putative phosphoribosyl transferase
MSDLQPRSDDSPISIHTEHGPLHGRLAPLAGASCLIVLAHAGATPEAHDDALAARLRQAGMATLVIDLLTHQEERFADVHNNVPLLAKRLLDCLTLIKRQMQNDEMPTLPIGLCAADSTSPVVIRVAGLRDNDIAAVVCRGGLIDLAGALYLRSLTSPLLVLLGQSDATLLASNQRALKEVACTKLLAIIQETTSSFASSGAFDAAASKVTDWFGAHCRPAGQEQAGTQQ